jgi:hypothetical protein
MLGVKLRQTFEPPAPGPFNADRDQRVDVDDAAAFAHLPGQRVHPDECVGAGVQGPVTERGNLSVQVLG